MKKIQDLCRKAVINCLHQFIEKSEDLNVIEKNVFKRWIGELNILFSSDDPTQLFTTPQELADQLNEKVWQHNDQASAWDRNKQKLEESLKNASIAGALQRCMNLHSQIAQLPPRPLEIENHNEFLIALQDTDSFVHDYQSELADLIRVQQNSDDIIENLGDVATTLGLTARSLSF